MKKKPIPMEEWEKIKEANIFSSFEEFEKCYDFHPNGKCFKKYTSYPWSKENFFFGTYEEFVEFQKNTSEIPFYLFEKVGKKIFNLTILSFFRDETNKICANCRCDCGKEVIKTYDSIQKGNARTCGCKGGKREIKSTISELMPAIVDEFWDFDKNAVSPKDVPVNSEDEFWWKGYSSSYKFPLQYFLRTVSGTSFPEQAISFFLILQNVEVCKRHIVEYGGKKYELDLFLPQYNLGIEYDGVFWHLDKEEKDNLKTKAIESLGIKFIRIREKGLKETGIKNGKEIVMREAVSNVSIANVINEIFSYLATESNLKFAKISANDIKQNKISIQSQYYSTCLKDSVANTYLAPYWSTKNKNEIYFLPKNSSQKCYFECEHGATFYFSPNTLTAKTKRFYDKGSKCIFHDAFICNRAAKVQKMLSINIIDSVFYLVDTVYLKFSIRNDNDTSFDPLSDGQAALIENSEFHIFKCGHGALTSKECKRIDNCRVDLCAPEYNQCIGKRNFELAPFSERIYSLQLKVKSTFSDDKDILIAFNLLDQMNWMYKVCLKVKVRNLNTTATAQIFTWEMYKSIIQNKNVWLYDLLSEEEARKIFLAV